MKEAMDIEIAPDGAVKVTVKCVKGAACKKVSEAVEKALGSTTKSVPTPEMYEKGKVGQVQ